MRLVHSLSHVIRHPICSIRQLMGMEMCAQEPGSRLRLKYEPENDLLSVWDGPPQLGDTIEVEPGVCVRLSASGAVIGVEIVDAAARLDEDPATLENKQFAQRLLDRYGRAALTELRLLHAR